MQMLIFGGAATGMINCQMMEGARTWTVYWMHSIGSSLKHAYQDKDGAVMRALAEGEVDIIGHDGVLARQQGIYFEPCFAQN